MGIYLKEVDFYPLLVCREGGMFAARFVDMPNCLAYGASASEAEAKATDALKAYLGLLAKHGRAFPSPSLVSPQSNSCDRYVAYIKAPATPVAPPNSRPA